MIKRFLAWLRAWLKPDVPEWQDVDTYDGSNGHGH